MRLALILSFAVLALGAFASAAAADHITQFKTPSRNIYCAREQIGHTDFLRCDLLHIAHPAPKPRGCKFGWGNSFGMSPRGHARALCVSDSVYDTHARVLRYGKTRHLGPFTCKSRTSGLRCSNRSHHGFVLNRTRFRYF